MDIHLPTVNAFLNGTTTCLLVVGLILIKRKNVKAHQVVMGTAFLTSTLFLISYLTHHALHGSTQFQGTGLWRGLYFSILISHSLLAAAILPLVLVTLFKAWKGSFEEHARLARWTWPLWMYVSITGVVIYWMLYKLVVF